MSTTPHIGCAAVLSMVGLRVTRWILRTISFLSPDLATSYFSMETGSRLQTVPTSCTTTAIISNIDRTQAAELATSMIVGTNWFEWRHQKESGRRSTTHLGAAPEKFGPARLRNTTGTRIS